MTLAVIPFYSGYLNIYIFFFFFFFYNDDPVIQLKKEENKTL